MFMGRVIGSVTASVVAEGLEAVKMLLIWPERADGSTAGPPVVACDATAQAGLGELVYLVDGREACLPLPVEFVPADATIIGIIDRVDVTGKDL